MKVGKTGLFHILLLIRIELHRIVSIYIHLVTGKVLKEKKEL
jgi:hypothetical protein